ncbi:MAG TPA: ATP-binding cassette domain-containing protein [Candidatus Eisenbacteria bacterium]|uniref:ATP-binding cassette domain-containing protein n=1 Tax=Eiseniibacteriota bacterium TaxID=2212470 RepID=A0A7V2AVD1_UNCEI|nr:ATP-binding cassette domain-containing protein [Candidatus Eisenbacteria bacterium]
MSILAARGLKKYYRSSGGLFLRGGKLIRAVDGVDIDLERGKTLGLVGESGCGKSTLARLLLRLEEPTEGTLEIEGTDFLSLKGGELRRARRMIQMIFQDPYSSLNPRLTVGSTIAEGIRIHRLARGAEVERKVGELLGKVGLPRAAISRYPHEFSGGQRQRIGIARALAVEPDIIVADEPVSSLDVSVQAQIINLLADLQKDMGLTYLFVAHDLGVVQHVSDRISVMYLGRMVESAPAGEMFSAPLHPYTEGLIASIPTAEPGRRIRAAIKGDVPSPVDIPAGCAFRTRCPKAFGRCGEETPGLAEVSPGRQVACWLHEG